MSTDLVDIRFEDEAPGAGVLTLSVEGQTWRLSPLSHATHPLGDLVRAALILAVGGERAACLFQRGPDAWRLECVRAGEAERLRIEVWDVEDADDPRPDRKVFEASCAVEAFAQAVERAASAVLAAQGLEAYRETWSRRFPMRALTALRAVLETRGPSNDRYAPPAELPAWT